MPRRAPGGSLPSRCAHATATRRQASRAPAPTGSRRTDGFSAPRRMARGERRDHAGEVELATAQQHQKMKDEVCRLVDHPVITLGARGQGKFERLFANFLRDLKVAL